MSDSQISVTLDFPITEQNTKMAREMLARAAQLDSNSVDAAAWLANLTMSDYLNGWNDAGQEALRDATKIVTRILAGSNPPPLAHYVQGFVHRAKGRHKQARESFKRAHTADPSFSRAIAQEGAQLINLGQWAAGRQLVDKAISMNPDSASIGVFYFMKGRAFFFEATAGDETKFADAIHWLELSRQKRGNLWYNRAYLIAAYHLGGRPKEARKELSRFKAKFPMIGVPDDIRNKLAVRNPDGNSHRAAGRGRDNVVATIKAIW